MLCIDVKDISTIITGASGVIGMAFAKGFLENGAKVANWDIVKNNEVEELCKRYPDNYIFCRTDICNEHSIRDATTEVSQKFGGIDVLCNIAGIIAKEKVDEVQKETIDKLYSINVLGTILTTKNIVPYLKKSKRPRIINMSSIQALIGTETYTPYSFSKGAVSAMTRVWALELAAYGITVNALCPGWADTEMARTKLVEHMANYHDVSIDEARDMILSYTPQRRFINPDEIAFAGMFLASSMAQAISGTEIVIDQGMTNCVKAGLNMKVPNLLRE